MGLQGNFYLFSLARFGLCFALLLIPTALMGGTLPVMAKFAVRRLGRLGGRVGQLYAINTLGAVVGVLAATFGLMEGLGLQGTTQAIAVVNFLVAGAAWLWGSQRAVDVDEGATTKETAHLGPRPVGRAGRLCYLRFCRPRL